MYYCIMQVIQCKEVTMNFKFTNDSPIYSQLTNHLKLYIASGKLKPNEKLPSVRELAMKIKINPNTVQKSLEKLEQEGLIHTEMESNGKYVTKNINLIKKIKQELAKEKIITYLRHAKLRFTKQEMP